MPVVEQVKRVYIFDGNGNKVYPKTVIDAVMDGSTGENLSVKLKTMVDDIRLNAGAISEIKTMIESGGITPGGSVDVDAINKAIENLDKKVTESNQTIVEHINNVENEVKSMTDELIDARKGYDGETYDSTGDAIRKQVQRIKTEISTDSSDIVEDIADDIVDAAINESFDPIGAEKIADMFDDI